MQTVFKQNFVTACVNLRVSNVKDYWSITHDRVCWFHILPALRKGVPSEPSDEGCNVGETRGCGGMLGSGPSFLRKHSTPADNRVVSRASRVVDGFFRHAKQSQRYFKLIHLQQILHNNAD